MFTSCDKFQGYIKLPAVKNFQKLVASILSSDNDPMFIENSGI